MKSIVLLILSCLVSLTRAEVRMAALFSDHAVLQQGEDLPVWGWAERDEEVAVTLAEQTVKTKAAGDGKWMVRFAKMKAGGPFTLTAKGSNVVVANDILIGDVWLGSGQSNMAMTVDKAANAAAEVKAAHFPQMRIFTERSGQSKTPRADAEGEWKLCSPDTISNFSAALYFFGREIHQSENIPVGLINASVGGTAIETWISADALAKVSKAKKPAVKKEAAPKGKWQPISGNAVLFQGKIAPLIPYALRGILWYQGEANSHHGKGDRYQQLLETLVNDWRARWGKELPFAWVQLPKFNRPGQGWSLVREGMLKSLRIPQTGMAITVDLGSAENIHPEDKQEVGHRLALWALGNVYHKKGFATSGPIPVAHEIHEAEIAVTFTHVEGGLKPQGGGALKGFQIAGADRQWHSAEVRIDGSKAIASSAKVKKPSALRYAWAAVPDCNLCNGAGLPASPFRTDDWPMPNDVVSPTSVPKP